MANYCLGGVSFVLVLLLCEGYSLGNPNCEFVQNNYVIVDGRLNDWTDIRSSWMGKKDRDGSMAIRCAYDDRKLYLSFNIRDNDVSRTKKRKAKHEDRLDLRIGGKGLTSPLSLRYFPATRAHKAVQKNRHRKFVKALDSLQDKGWSLEISIPLKKIPGYHKNAPVLSFDIIYRDSDRKRNKRNIYDGLLVFPAGSDMLRGFLEHIGAKRNEIKLDVAADMYGSEGVERVVFVRDMVAVFSNRYSYIKIPVKHSQDIVSLKVIDLAGQGRSFILADYWLQFGDRRQRIVSVWVAEGSGRVERNLAFVVEERAGKKRVVNEWKLVARGKYRKLLKKKKQRVRLKKGYDILVQSPNAEGYTQKNYRDSDTVGVRPILLPWSKSKKTLYYFEGNVALEGELKK